MSSSVAYEKAAAAKSKRGPGRPPKKLPAPPLDRDGIVETSTDANNRLEFVYDDPMMLKSLFAYFKNLKAVDIHIRCAPQGITFFTRDAAQSCRIVAELPGSRVNHFYCSDLFFLGLNRNNVERIFSSIDKSFFKVTLLYRYDDPDRLVIIFKDSDIEKECRYSLSISTLDPDDELFAAEALTSPAALQAFPVEFQLTAKQFKKTVTDIGHYSDTITFEKLKDFPLQLTYTRVGLAYNEIYRSPEKINLRSEVEDRTIFRCTVAVGNIKSLASAMVTDTVGSFARKRTTSSSGPRSTPSS